MTVLNGITQGKRAYIITDTAWIREDDATISTLASKFIQGYTFPFLIAFTGNVNPFTLVHKIEEKRPRKGDELLKALTEILHDASARESDLDVGLLIATWSKRVGRPMLHLMSNSETHWPGLVAPFEPHAAECVISGQLTVDQALGRPLALADLADPKRFDPRRDGATLLEAQRRFHRFEHLGPPSYRIGGAVEVGVLTRKGTKIERVREWSEDRVGQLIQPLAASRQEQR